MSNPLVHNHTPHLISRRDAHAMSGSKSQTRLKRIGKLAALASLPAMASVVFTGGSASAHGAPMDPGSRTYLCYLDALNGSGALEPSNPACAAALEEGGANAFYNWFAVLQSDGQGRTEGFLNDGELCSGGSGAYDFSGFDLPRDDWPSTSLTSGATMEFTYNVWAHHPGTFHLYVTNDSYDPTQPLTWDMLEDEPFHSETDPPYRGDVGTIEAEYYWDAELPAGLSGQHLIYMVWERSDSPETFYSCSDVVFDGGSGEVSVPGGGELADAELAERFTAPVAEAHGADHAHHADHASHQGVTPGATAAWVADAMLGR